MHFRPPCIPLLSHALSQDVTIEDLLHHRWITVGMAGVMLFDAFVFGAPIAFGVGILGGFLTIEPTITRSLIAFGFVAFGHIAWQLAWMVHQSPVISTLFLGGVVYIVDDGGKEPGFTTEVGVAEHPNISGVVEAVIPGVVFFSPAELRQFKPSYHYAQIPWSAEAIAEAMVRQRERRLDWN